MHRKKWRCVKNVIENLVSWNKVVTQPDQCQGKSETDKRQKQYREQTMNLNWALSGAANYEKKAVKQTIKAGGKLEHIQFVVLIAHLLLSIMVAVEFIAASEFHVKR